MKALRYNEGKPDWSLLHFASLIPMIRVLEFGMNKYTTRDDSGKILVSGRHNWQKGMARHEVLSCLQRHLAALMDGEETDAESGQSHMGHIMCNAMFYCYYSLTGKFRLDSAETDSNTDCCGKWDENGSCTCQPM